MKRSIFLGLAAMMTLVMVNPASAGCGKNKVFSNRAARKAAKSCGGSYAATSYYTQTVQCSTCPTSQVQTQTYVSPQTPPVPNKTFPVQ